MEAVIVIWWLTLAIAVFLTVIALGIITRFILHAREIDRLARITLVAAQGVAGNTANIALLDTLLEHATALAATCAAIDGVAAKIHGHGAAVVRTLSGRAG